MFYASPTALLQIFPAKNYRVPTMRVDWVYQTMCEDQDSFVLRNGLIRYIHDDARSTTSVSGRYISILSYTWEEKAYKTL